MTTDRTNQQKLYQPRLPISKTRRIAKTDKDYILTSTTGIVATAFATELFIQSLAEQAIMMSSLRTNKSASRSGDKSRNVRVTYADLADAVLKNDQFRFLEDVIPRNNPFAFIGKIRQGGGDGVVESRRSRSRSRKDSMGKDGEEGMELMNVVQTNALRGQSTLPFFEGKKKIKVGESNDGAVGKVVVHSNSEEDEIEEDDDGDGDITDGDGVTQEEEYDDDDDEGEEEEEEEENHDDEHVKMVEEQLQEIERLDHVEDLDRRDAAKSANDIMLNRNQEVDDADVEHDDSADEDEDEDDDMGSISSSSSDDTL